METTLMHPPVHDRVREHTAPVVNERIDLLARARVLDSIEAGHDAVVARLSELDREWDVDRALMVNFAVVGAIGFELGQRYDRRWMYLLRAQQFFLAMHAVIGWSPPLILFRRLGFRTTKEIAAERAILLRNLNDEPDQGTAARE